jgi:3-deoxy-D-manno-octulosonic-acid transferase
MGELRKFYSLAATAFVGRSLVSLGGSDVMEAAGLAKPVIVGPHTENFAEAVRLLLECEGALEVASVEQLAEAVVRITRDSELRDGMGAAARAQIVAQRGATERTVTRILEFGQIG